MSTKDGAERPKKGEAEKSGGELFGAPLFQVTSTSPPLPKPDCSEYRPVAKASAV
ncbi:hypothetical protein [Mucilaginibacter paludis]|uniref:hypothetical protein n=1 Tax=Mucilaginibacter paludis TaxID=423351 RepID=UPI0012FCE477|nr:hypothetical protein [Mucilaginibacter paludis]